MSIEYRTVVGAVGYEVGSDGTVWTDRVKIRDENGRFIFARSDYWIRLREGLPTTGYPQVAMRLDGRVRSVNIHALVLSAFAGPRPDGMQACHCNGIRNDNRADNLRWDTIKGNHADKKKHGTHQQGSLAGNSRLTEIEVAAIRELWKRGACYQSQLGRWFGVRQATISSILRRKTWTHVA